MSVTYQKLANRLQSDPKALDYTQNQLMYLMSRIFFHIGDALASGEDVYLEGFGRFYPDCKPPRKIKSGLTSEEHMTDFKVFVKFNAFKQLNTQVQELMKRLGIEEYLGGEDASTPEESARKT